MGESNPGLATSLISEPEAILDRATALYGQSRVRLPGQFDAPATRQVLAPIVESLGEAMQSATAQPGSPELRELEKTVAFVASSWATDRGSGFDLTGMLLAARDALGEWSTAGERRQLGSLFDWLLALAAESFADGGVRSARERMREELESGMPVVQVAPELPAGFLVGAPDSYTLDGVFGRLVMMVVRVGARCVIVDATGLTSAVANPLLVSLDRFLRHRKLQGQLTVLAVGLTAEAESLWGDVAATAGTALEILPSFDQAVSRALEMTEYRLVRRPSN